MSMGTFNSNK